MRRVAIILNPLAGRGAGARLKPQIARAFPEAEIWETSAPGEGARLAREAAKTAEILLAAGGDGTLGETLNGAFENGALQNGATLGVLPLGTGNDFARTLGILNLESAIQAAQGGQTRRVDVWNCENQNGARLFLNVCGTGFDALVAARINAARSHPLLRHLSGTPAYLQAVGAELWRLQSAPLTLQIDGKTHHENAVLCAIANAQSYGGGMRVAPDAEIDDGLLDVIVIGQVSRVEFARAFPGVFRGAHLNHPKVKTFRGREIEIAGELPLLCDGETIGALPARFSLAGTTNFLAPS